MREGAGGGRIWNSQTRLTLGTICACAWTYIFSQNTREYYKVNAKYSRTDVRSLGADLIDHWIVSAYFEQRLKSMHYMYAQKS